MTRLGQGLRGLMTAAALGMACWLLCWHLWMGALWWIGVAWMLVRDTSWWRAVLWAVLAALVVPWCLFRSVGSGAPA